MLLGGWAVLATGCQPRVETLQVRPSDALTDARVVLMRSFESDSPIVRANALEGMCETLGAQAGGALIQSLEDPSPVVRFTAAMCVGDLQYGPAEDKLRTMMKEEPGVGERDWRVICATIYALHRLGIDEYTTMLGDLLVSEEPEIQANAAWAMGKIGEPAARIPLRSVLSDQNKPLVRLNILTALALLGDRQAAGYLEALTKTPSLDGRMAAIEALGNLDTPRVPMVLEGLTTAKHPPQVRLAAMRELAGRGEVSDRNYAFAVKCCHDPNEMMRRTVGRYHRYHSEDVIQLRMVAARALGAMGREAAVNTLHPMLENAVPRVRLAAAVSVMQLLEAYRTAQEEVRPLVPQERIEPQPEDDTPPLPERKLHTSGGKE